MVLIRKAFRSEVVLIGRCYLNNIKLSCPILYIASSSPSFSQSTILSDLSCTDLMDK